MKVRNGFVSNSSSSSFVCEICGGVESGYDVSMREVGILECENGHEFHIDCADKDYISEATREEKYELLKDSYYVHDKEQLEKNFVELSDEDFDDKYEDAILDTLCDRGVPEKYCPVCQKLAEYKKDPEWEEYLRLKEKFNGVKL